VSNRRMRKIILIFFLLLTASSWAQAPLLQSRKRLPFSAQDQLVTWFNRALPKVTLEFFLKYESTGAPITWEVNNCGEQTGNPETDQGRDFPMCVEADFDKDHAAVSVLVSVGTFKKGPSGVPELFSGYRLERAQPSGAPPERFAPGTASPDAEVAARFSPTRGVQGYYFF
jgi:hypothetical protein